MWKQAITLGAILTAATAYSRGDMASEVGKGQKFAEQRCASCHATGDRDASHNPAAPPFRDLYRRYPVDALRPAFLQGLEVGHRDMPRFVLTPQQIDDLLAFLHDLNPCGKPSSDDEAMARCFAPMGPSPRD